MRENFPLAIAAVLIIFSFGIVTLFVSVELIESKTSDEINLQQFDDIVSNATEIAMETRNQTKYHLLQFFNNTSDAIRNNTELQRFQQLWENP